MLVSISRWFHLETFRSILPVEIALITRNTRQNCGIKYSKTRTMTVVAERGKMYAADKERGRKTHNG